MIYYVLYLSVMLGGTQTWYHYPVDWYESLDDCTTARLALTYQFTNTYPEDPSMKYWNFSCHATSEA